MDAFLEREIESLSVPPPPRARELRLPGWLKLGVQLADRLSPEAAGAVARRLFFSPIKRRPTAKERAALAEATRFFVDTRFGRVVAYSWGHGPAVCLAHGWGGDAAQMTPLAAAFAAAGYRAIAVDMPGHGDSEGSQASLVHFGEAILAVAKVVGPLAGLVAHSLACAGATLQLARDGAHSLGGVRVVFIAPPADLEPFWARFRRGTSLSALAWRSMQAQSEAWLGLSFGDIIPAALAPRMAAPLLVIHDDGDREIPQREGARLAELWPGARFASTHGLGHTRILASTAAADAAVWFVAG